MPLLLNESISRLTRASLLDLAASHKLLPIPKRRQWWLNTTARDMPIFCQKFQHHANSTDIQLSDELDDDDDDDRQEDGFAVPAASDKNTDPLTLLYHLRTIPCLDGVGAFLFHYCKYPPETLLAQHTVLPHSRRD